MTEIRSEFNIMLLPFSKKQNKENKCTYAHTSVRAFSPNHSNFAQIIPTLRSASTSSIKLTQSLAQF